MTQKNLSAKEKLSKLRAQLTMQGLDGVLLTRADRFQGEEVRPEDEYIAWLTGFTGSAGAALVLAERAVVATDSRYSLQIAHQIDSELYQTINTENSGLAKWMAACSTNNEPVTIGFDSWTISKTGQAELPSRLGSFEIVWQPVDVHPVQAVWTDRPTSTETQIFAVDQTYTGLSATEKLEKAAKELQHKDVNLQFISAPDVMMWLTNLRGRDLRFTPVHLCFGILTAQADLTFISDNNQLAKWGYQSVGWSQLEEHLRKLKGRRIICDYDSLPIAVYDLLERAGLHITFGTDPAIALKAQKNPEELEGFRQAHFLDGLALSRFFFWLETKADRESLSESELGKRLTAFRAASDDYICDSFPPIVGWQDHGAIIHYRAEDGQDYHLSGPGVILLDSGAHYRCGTTDITRTVYLGDADQTPCDDLVRKASLVLAAHCQLAQAVFPAGTTGVELDAICRAPLWAAELDFLHGTGHGVGHILNVHERPVTISKRAKLALQPGHVLSNEPGYYEEGRFGIRHETLVHVTTAQNNFLRFETLSCFPFDCRLIDNSFLSATHLTWLNDYHEWVYEKLAPHLEPEIKAWLAEKCTPL